MRPFCKYIGKTFSTIEGYTEGSTEGYTEGLTQ